MKLQPRDKAFLYALAVSVVGGYLGFSFPPNPVLKDRWREPVVIPKEDPRYEDGSDNGRNSMPFLDPNREYFLHDRSLFVA